MNQKDTSIDTKYRVHGPFRRNAWLLVFVTGTLILAPGFHRLLKSYRAVVLEVQTEKVLLGWERRAPEWVSLFEAVQPGVIVEKVSGQWSPKVMPQTEKDVARLALYERYVRVYEGEVVDIVPRVNPTSPDKAVIKTNQGSLISLEVWSDHLLELKRGTRVRKLTNSWDPVIVPNSQDESGGLE